MKILITLLLFQLAMVCAYAQSPTLNTLIRYVETPLHKITDELISKEGWELAESTNRDSTIVLKFQSSDCVLIITKKKNNPNEAFLLCGKETYTTIDKSLASLKPKLIDSKVTDKGHLIKTFLGEKYGYTVTVAPKSAFAISVYHKGNMYLKEALENPQAYRDTIK